ncbi:MAG: filamentous hemagglutinin N-terminal domain-containing protein [Immundisolibacteraceae bacterium]|nr:filamentous hemagglutinin N-terminal domain-containing protein [Immundisolibacteraceae bacterium]
MTRTGKKQPKKFPRLNDRFSAGVLSLSIAHIVRPKQVLALLAASVPGLTLAGPQGGQVVAGSASINRPNANTTNIHQSSNRAAIDWQSFSLGNNDYVQFFQPNSSSVALNRVVGGNPSSILGNLTANGQVFLVNPAGVYFGQGATVDVAGLVATTMNIGNDDFMAGNYLFSRDLSSPDNATVINKGILAARESGYVVLSGDYVENNGIISAQLGTVALAAGAGMTLDIAGDNLINFTVDAASVSELAGVDNAGDLYADGGRVIMTAEVADNLVNAAVNNSGRVQAQGVLEQDGAIYLVAHGGDVVNSGIVDASGPDGDGGFVRIRSTDDVTLTSTSEINASGGSGEGGFIRVVAEENLDFQAGATIDAQGAAGEQGGFVEVSGHGGLKLKGDVQVGKDGQLLIDPANLTVVGGAITGPTGSSAIANIGELFIETQLQSGANVALVASDSISFSGAFAGNDLDGVNGYGGSGGDLFIGIGNISVGSTLGFFSNTSPASFAGGIPPNYTADPSGSISLNGTNISVDGDLTLQAGTVSGNISSMASLAGNNIEISAAGGSIAPSSSSLNITATGDVDITATDITFSGSTANLSISASGSVNINTDINLFGSGGDGSAGAFLNISGNGLAINGNINVDAQDTNDPPSASIDLQGGSGALIVNGDVSALATFSGTGASYSPGSATITYSGASILQTGDVSAIAQGTGSSGYGGILPMNANVSMTASAGSLTVTGQTLAQASNQNSESANAHVSLHGDTGVNVQNVSALATAPGSDASASVAVFANTGPVNTGAVTVSAIADTSSGNAFANFDVTTSAGAITVNGAINLLASGGTSISDDVTAIASFNTPTNLQLNGPVSINTVGGTGLSDGAVFLGFANNVTANGLISVISQTPNTKALITFDGNGGGGPGNGTLIASTSTSNLEVANFANATVDNTSSTVPLSLDLNGSLGNLSVTTNGDMDLIGQSAAATGNVLLGASGNLDVSLSAVSANVVDLVAGTGDLLLNGASIIGTSGVFLSAGGSVLNGPAVIDGGMVGVFAGQDIDLALSNIFVGTASDASRLPGDPLVTDFLLANGIPVPSKNPNALFLGGNSVKIGNLHMSGHYLWVESNDISFTGLVNTPQNVLAQLLPSDPAASIGITQSKAFNQLVNFNNTDHFEPFSGTTIAIGASFINSNITIDNLNVGSKNILFVTNGTVEGDGLVTSTGLVALLSLTPVTDQTIDIVNTIDSVDDLVASAKNTLADDLTGEALDEDDDDEDENEDIAADSGSEGGDALIEQDDNPDERLECA